MNKQYKLTGTITLPIEMVVECDSTKTAPSEFAEKILLGDTVYLSDLFPDHLVQDSDFIDSPKDGKLVNLRIFSSLYLKESGAIEFNDIEELDDVTESKL